MSEPLFLPPGAPKPPFHPFANLFPMMTETEQRELATSIKDKGQMQAVVLHRGFVLDGRNRIEACAIAGVGARCEQFTGSDREALDFVVALNLERRHLTPSQRAMVAAKLATLRVGANQYSGKSAGQGALALGSATTSPRQGEVEQGAPIGAGDALIDIDPEIMAQVEERGGHTVTMTLDHVGESGPHSVGTCRCGAVFRVPRDGTNPRQNIARANEMNRLIEAHWRDSLGLSPAPVEAQREEPAFVSQEQAADIMGVGRRQVQRAAVVQEHAVEELREAVTSGAIAVSAAAAIAEKPAAEQSELLAALRGPDGKLTPQAKKEVAKAAKELRTEKQAEKRAKRSEKEATLALRQQALPDMRFGVILEDYEWHFKVHSAETGMDRHAANHYPTSADALTPEAIVERTRARFAVAAPDCVLFMWATIPHLAIALKVMELRGFTYKSHFAWPKDKIGLGYWVREKHELLLIGTKSNVPCVAQGQNWDSWQAAPKGNHSQKPEWQYELIEAYFPNLPKIELNARSGRPGWYAWGNEAPEAPELDLVSAGASLAEAEPDSTPAGAVVAIGSGATAGETAPESNVAPPHRSTQAVAGFGSIGVSRNRNCGSCEHFHAPCACNRVVGLIENRNLTICDLFAAFDAPVRVQTETELARAEFERRVEGAAP